MTFWARTTKNLHRPGDIEHALNVFQQDPAPAHKAKGTPEWMTATCPGTSLLCSMFMAAVFI